MGVTHRGRLVAAAAAVAVLGLTSACGDSDGDSKAGDWSTQAQGQDQSGLLPTAQATPDQAGVGVNGATREPSASAGQADGSSGDDSSGDSGTKGGKGSSQAVPTRLVMPSIGFDENLISRGVNADGEINPPAGVPQWYNKSVKPGQDGISVIAGHVMYDGPDVFYKLDKLSVGDVVTVESGDGKSRKFKVYAEESVDKHKLQTDARVWGSSDKPVLALITCDAGSRVVGNHHVSNYVVWASPV